MTDPKQLTHDFGGKWMRSYGCAPCPCCQPERRRDQNGLTIAVKGNKLLMHCKKSGCDFVDILAAAGIQPGSFEVDHDALLNAQQERKEAEAKTLQRARLFWDRGTPIQETHGEAYMRGRGITCELPDSLRWVSDAYHAPSGTYGAALVANVVDADGREMGIHRTFFDKSGNRMSTSAKMMLGPCSAGAVQLSAEDGPLVVCEGIETGLSLLSGLLDQPASVWAALSTSGMSGLNLPSPAGKLIIATDGDEAGRIAGNKLAERALRNGWEVFLLPAPDGQDWNDVLQKGAAA